tara:strand:+ start:112 stop:312 length:201 start_codon:yes stop_codon:yes gene_type:complete
MLTTGVGAEIIAFSCETRLIASFKGTLVHVSLGALHSFSFATERAASWVIKAAQCCSERCHRNGMI